jgi:hypothetical protein
MPEGSGSVTGRKPVTYTDDDTQDRTDCRGAVRVNSELLVEENRNC